MKGSEGKNVCCISFASPSWEKQKEVLDSIHYAQRIQMALMPSEKRVAHLLSRLILRK